MVSILLVDDTASWPDTICGRLQDMGYAVRVAGSLGAARTYLEAQEFDLVFTNLHLIERQFTGNARGDYLGGNVISLVHEKRPGTPCFLVSAHPNLLNEKVRPHRFPEYVDCLLKSDSTDIDVLWLAGEADHYREQVRERMRGAVAGHPATLGGVDEDDYLAIPETDQGIQDRRKLISMLRTVFERRTSEERTLLCSNAGLGRFLSIRWDAAADIVASQVVGILNEYGFLPGDRGYMHALCALLQSLLADESIRVADRKFMAGLIVRYKMVTRPPDLEELCAKYGLDPATGNPVDAWPGL